jgi:ammonia channel protein AmtB
MTARSLTAVMVLCMIAIVAYAADWYRDDTCHKLGGHVTSGCWSGISQCLSADGRVIELN